MFTEIYMMLQTSTSKEPSVLFLKGLRKEPTSINDYIKQYKLQKQWLKHRKEK